MSRWRNGLPELKKNLQPPLSQSASGSKGFYNFNRQKRRSPDFFLRLRQGKFIKWTPYLQAA
jgi:hypothetical protein